MQTSGTAPGDQLPWQAMACTLWQSFMARPHLCRAGEAVGMMENVVSLCLPKISHKRLALIWLVATAAVPVLGSPCRAWLV